MRQLLLLLCRYPFDEKNRETLSALVRDVQDWHRMIKLINDHGIIALAAYNIKEAGLGEMVPEYAKRLLEDGKRQSMIRNAWLTERWKEIDKILSEAGIKHVLLKGMALEYTVYGGQGLRQMNDNDIFINPEDSINGWQLLQKNGFSMAPLKSRLFRKIMFDLGHHLPTLYKNGYAVEIHDKLAGTRDGIEPGYHELSDNVLEVMVDDRKALILNNDIHMNYLISHFERHAREGECQLRLFADIVLLGNDSSVDFPDRFITDPLQKDKAVFRRSSYKATVRNIPAEYRLRFLLGDLFPSLQWMKQHYRCSIIKVLFLYPLRIGKLRWLI